MKIDTKILVKIASIIIGAIFIISAFTKLADIKYFTDLVLQYNINIFVYTIPFLIIAEIFIGIELLFILNTKRNAILSVAMLFFLTLAYAYGYSVKGIEDCGCFGESLQVPPIFVFLRNVVLIILGLFLFKNTTENKTDKFRKTIALIILGFGIFFTGNYFKLPANMQKPKQHILLHQDILKTEFGNYYNFDKDSTYMVFVFSYSCSHCLNSFENAKQYSKSSHIDKEVFFVQGNQESRNDFFRYFALDNDISFFENNISGKDINSFPTTLIIKNNKIDIVYVGALPSVLIFEKKFLN